MKRSRREKDLKNKNKSVDARFGGYFSFLSFSWATIGANHQSWGYMDALFHNIALG